jgi:hypothetical protein
MSSEHCCSLIAALVAVLVCAPGTGVRAQQPAPDAIAEARQHFDRGVALFEHRDFDGALAEFLRAQQLSGRPSVWFNIGATYHQLHRYPEAMEALRRYLAEASAANPRQRTEAERSLREIEALIARLRIVAEPADASVVVDGRAVTPGAEVLVGPGRHLIEVAAEGFRAERREVVVASGDTQHVRVSLAPLPRAPVTALPPPPEAPARALLAVAGTPPDATVAIAGSVRPASAPVEVPPGRYPLEVRAPGMRAWRGTITLAANVPRTLQVTLVPERSGPPPALLWATAGTGAALALAAAGFGIAALGTHADYVSRDANDPHAPALAARGQGYALAADLLGLGALATGGVALYLAARIEWTPRASTALLAVTPAPSGALLTTRWTF